MVEKRITGDITRFPAREKEQLRKGRRLTVASSADRAQDLAILSLINILLRMVIRAFLPITNHGSQPGEWDIYPRELLS